MIDEIDARILDLLQTDGRLSNAAIAEQVGLTTSTVFERIKKLEKKRSSSATLLWLIRTSWASRLPPLSG